MEIAVMSNVKDSPGTAAASVASMVLGAAIVASALLAGSFMVMSAIDRAGARLDSINAGLADARKAAQSGAPRQAQAPPANMPPGPDPNRRYTLNAAGAPALGPKQARVKIVEFSDFQCPFCSRAVGTLRKIRADYPKDVQIIWKNFPLAMHTKAPAAHAAAEAAHRQGKFWEMYDLLFDNQKQLEPEHFEKYAAQLGLDVGRFKADVASEDVRARVDADEKEGEAFGINGAPAFFINGRFLYGAQPYEAFKKMVDEELAQK
jgi:protein-disulfide isomerase